MKIKIVKNNPPNDFTNASDISKFVGQIFNAHLEEGNVTIEDEDSELYLLTIFKGEYEIVEE